jgi:hypothetical protein
MPRLSSYSVKILLIAALFAALAAVHLADFAAFVETPLAPRKAFASTTSAAVDQVVEQSISQYEYTRYSNVIDDSIFAVNAVIKKEPIKIVKPEPKPEPPPPPPPPKPKPFTANLEVTGIAITPERKLVMVWDKQKKETHVLREREKLYRWKVVSIGRERVILRHERGGRYEFIVNEDTLVNN